MNNPPFSIGQKVVCVDAKKPSKISGYIPKYLIDGNIYIVQDRKLCPIAGEWCIGVGTEVMHYCWRFTPIQTNYSDATAEILEKFKSPAETPDKILTPEPAHETN